MEEGNRIQDDHASSSSNNSTNSNSNKKRNKRSRLVVGSSNTKEPNATSNQRDDDDGGAEIDHWRRTTARLQEDLSKARREMQQLRDAHNDQLRDQRMQYLTLRGEWGRQKLELAACQDQLDEAEMAKAMLEINNDELFRRIHALNMEIARMRGSMPTNATVVDDDDDESPQPEAMGNTLCLCCCEASIDTVFRCRHAVMCEDCVIRMMHHADESDVYEDETAARCPICRDPITFTRAGPGDSGLLLAPYTRIFIGA